MARNGRQVLTALLAGLVMFGVTLLFSFQFMIGVEAVTLTRVYGRVVDAVTGRPVGGASVLFWDNETDIMAEAETDASGIYEVNIRSGIYHVYAYCNRSSTPGFDYLPTHRRVFVEGKTLNLPFSLLPAASINVRGLRPFELLPDVDRVFFMLVDPSELLNETYSVTVYGEDLPINHLLNLTGRTVLVPSGMPFKIEVDVLYVNGATRHFTIDSYRDRLNLTQGSQALLYVQKIMIRAEYELGYVSERIEMVDAMIRGVAAAGFPEFEEFYESSMERCRVFLEMIGLELARGSYDQARYYIVEIYRILEIVEERVSQLYVKPEDLDYALSLLSSVEGLLREAETFGFYTRYERSQLSRAENLIESARSAMAEGDHFRATADLREAELVLRNVEKEVSSMYSSAAQAVFFITPFLGFSAVILASLLVDDRKRRIALSLVIYALLLGSLYPGYTILLKQVLERPDYYSFEGYITLEEYFARLRVYSYLLLVILSFSLPLFVLYGLPRIFGGRSSKYGLCFVDVVTQAFSISARNLRRRRLRSLLTASLLLISVFALITLTHVSVEHGFFKEQQPGQSPSEGLLIRKRREGSLMPFEPMDEMICRWLGDRREVRVMVPLIENRPKIFRLDGGRYSYLTVLYAPDSGSTFHVRGLLGVYPTMESNITKIDEIVVKGRFLRNDDLDGILISREAAERLQVEPNATVELYGRRFTVTGIFDSERLKETRDLDGEPIVPQWVSINHMGEGVPSVNVTRYVSSVYVVILHGETALELPGTVISRVVVKTRRVEEMEPLARLAVLDWPDVEAYYSHSGRIYRMRIGEHRVESGLGFIIVPMMIAALNIGVAMIGEVYERKRETLIMTCVGLNPLHISSIFVAESLIIGVTAGTVGYILGINSYRLMALFPFPLEVRQKVEPIWGILALCLSISASILGSLIPAAKASMIATPSLIRRWRMERFTWRRPRASGEPLVIEIPLEVHGKDVIDFFLYMKERLQNYAQPEASHEWFEGVYITGHEPPEITLYFDHRWSQHRVHTLNRLVPVKSGPHHYTFRLISRTMLGAAVGGHEQQIRKTVNVIRRLVLHYSYEHRLEAITGSHQPIATVS